jgi:hypothetical protein
MAHDVQDRTRHDSGEQLEVRSRRETKSKRGLEDCKTDCKRQQQACECETETRGQPRRREWAPLMSARAWDCPSLNHQGRRGIPHAHGWMLVAKRGARMDGRHSLVPALTQPSQAPARVTKRGPDRDGLPQCCLAEYMACRTGYGLATGATECIDRRRPSPECTNTSVRSAHVSLANDGRTGWLQKVLLGE